MARYGPWRRLKYAYDSFKNVSGKPELAFYLRKQNMNLNKHFHFYSQKKPQKPKPEKQLRILHHY